MCIGKSFNHFIVKHIFLNAQVLRFFFPRNLGIKMFLIKACVVVFQIIMKMRKPLASEGEEGPGRGDFILEIFHLVSRIPSVYI